MIELGIARGPDPTERRSYSGLILQGIEAAARGAGSPAASWARSAACELAALYWSRGLSTAIVAPQNRRTAALTPLVLSTIARRLARAGEFLAVLDVRDGRLALDEAWQWFIEGGPRRETWRYRVTESGPSNTETRNLPADEVCHVRYAWDAAQPWRGASPAAFAANGAGLAGGIDATLSGEANSAFGYVISAADLGGDADDDAADPFAAMRADLASLRGGLTVAPTQRDALGRGKDGAPASDLRRQAFRIRAARINRTAAPASARGRGRMLRRAGAPRRRTIERGRVSGSGAGVSRIDPTGARGDHRGASGRGDRATGPGARVPENARYRDSLSGDRVTGDGRGGRQRGPGDSRNMTRRERFTAAGRCTVCGRVRDRTDRLRCAACRGWRHNGSRGCWNGARPGSSGANVHRKFAELGRGTRFAPESRPGDVGYTGRWGFRLGNSYHRAWPRAPLRPSGGRRHRVRPPGVCSWPYGGAEGAEAVMVNVQNETPRRITSTS